MTRIFSLAAFVLTLAACGSIDPLPGEYTITSATASTDTCDLADDAGIEDSVFDMTIADDAVTIAIQDSDGIAFDCTLDKEELVCDDLVQTQDAGGDDGDATITIEWGFGGTFADETNLDPGDLSLNYSCAGADCDAFAADAGVALPCESTWTITAAQ